MLTPRRTRNHGERDRHVVSRRSLLRRAALAVFSASPLSACLRKSSRDATPGTALVGTQENAHRGPGNIIHAASTLADTGIGNPILTGAVDWVQFYVFNRLMTYNDIGTLDPELAASWEYSPDKRELTLHLAEATWHDGAPFTADDVIFTLDAVSDADTDTPLRAGLQINGKMVTWEKIDERAVRITTPTPYAPLLYHLNEIAVLPKHLLSDVRDINVASFNAKPIGTGPYRVADWQVGERILLEPFPQHFRGSPNNDGLVVQFFTDAASRTTALDDGAVDLMFVPPDEHRRYDAHPDFTLFTYVYFTPVTLSFNFRHPLLLDATIRQAIALGIDKAALTLAATGGVGVIAHNQYSETGPLDRYNDYATVTPTPFDPVAAARLLEDRGYHAGEDGVRVTPNGQRLSFNLVTHAGFAEYVKAKDVLKDNLAAIGIEVLPQVVDFATLRALRADTGVTPSAHAMELGEWPHPYEFDPDVSDELESHHTPPHGRNYMYFHDDECDRLILAGQTEISPEKRVRLYQELDRRRSQILPALPLYCTVDGWVVSKRVQGLKPTAYFQRYRLLGAADWWKQG